MNLRNKCTGAAVLAAYMLAAQCVFGADSSVTLRVPFAFVVAGRTMPAGAYTVETSGGIVSIRGNRNSVLVAGGPQEVDRNVEPGLFFARHGGTAYLVGVQTEDDARSIGSGVTPR